MRNYLKNLIKKLLLEILEEDKVKHSLLKYKIKLNHSDFNVYNIIELFEITKYSLVIEYIDNTKLATQSCRLECTSLNGFKSLLLNHRIKPFNIRNVTLRIDFFHPELGDQYVFDFIINSTDNNVYDSLSLKTIFTNLIIWIDKFPEHML